MDDPKIPVHVAIIMDGNGRWAQTRHLTRAQGHLEGVKRVEEITQAALKAGVKVLTLYAFSTENWSRPQDEVGMLMRTLVSVLNQKAKELHANGIRIRFIGRRQGVPDHVLAAIRSAEGMTGANTTMTLNVAFNYGGRAEIADAVKALAPMSKPGAWVLRTSPKRRWAVTCIPPASRTRTFWSALRVNKGSAISCSGSCHTRSCILRTSSGRNSRSRSLTRHWPSLPDANAVMAA